MGPSLLGKRIRLYVNHPVADADGNVEPFERTQYRQLEWQHDSRNKDDDTAVYVDVVTIAPGSYHYYFIDHERFGYIEFLIFSSLSNQMIYYLIARIPNRAVPVTF